MLFRIGKVHISKQVLASSITPEDMVSAFAQYIAGDWGEITTSEEMQNDTAIAIGERIVARYISALGFEFCITTFAGETQILLPSEVKVFVGVAE